MRTKPQPSEGASNIGGGVIVLIKWNGGDDVLIDQACEGTAVFYRYYFYRLPQLLAN